MTHFIPDDEVVSSLLENSDIEEDNIEVSWDPNDFFLGVDFNPPDEPFIEYTEKWEKKSFQSKNIPKMVPSVESCKTPMEYFSKYFPDSLFEEITTHTVKILVSRGKPDNYCDIDCIKKFFATHALMGIFRCPQKHLYFDPKFQYGPIANALTHDKFKAIRMSLHAVDVDSPDEIDKMTSRLWKVQPVIEAVRSRCHQLVRNSNNYCIGQQDINLETPRLGTPYNWRTRGVGLKNFIITDPQGLIVDFEIFQGSHTDLPDRCLGTRASIVLRLARTVPGACLYFGPNFTTVPLMNELANRNINGTGLIIPCRWKKNLYEFTKDKQMKMGNVEEICREDGKVCAIKWMDTKSIMVMSTVYGTEPTKRFVKFDEKTRHHVTVTAPLPIANYKRNILGIELSNQIMDLYSTSIKSSKWPVNVILYLFDLAVTNSFFEYKQGAKASNKKYKQMFDAAHFRLEIIEGLLGESLKSTSLNNSKIAKITPKGTVNNVPLNQPSALSSIDERFDGKDHWMIVDKTSQVNKNQKYCKKERCTSRTYTMCTKCKVFLCYNTEKNCFYSFHNK